MSALSMTVEAHSPFPLIRVEGQLDHHTAPDLPVLVERLVHARGPIQVVIDLAGVTFVNSAGVRALVQARQTVSRLVLRSPSPLVRRVLTVTGDAPHFEIDPSVAG